MTWAAVAIGGAAVVGGAVNYAGGQQAANAAGSAASSTLDEARKVRRESLDYSQTSGDKLRALAAATPQELMMQQKGLMATQSSLDSRQRLMDAIDPSLMEASKQALQLLQGGSAASLDPVMKQRQYQRTQLLNSLRAQYGPGAETSAAGQQALQNFDMETNTMTSQLQTQQLGVLGNTMTQLNQNRPDMAAGYAQGLGLSGMLSQRMAGAEGQAAGMWLNASQGTQQNVIDNAGAGSVAAQLNGRNNAQLGNALIGGASTGLGAYLGRNNNNPANTTNNGVVTNMQKYSTDGGNAGTAGNSYRDTSVIG